MKLYLDACSVTRPFDDQNQDRVRLEAEAIVLILAHVRRGEWEWVSSDVLRLEISRIPNVEKQLEAALVESYATGLVELEDAVVTRAEQLQRQGFGGYDALHLASAEVGGGDVFLTTDDRLGRLAARQVDLRVRVANPLVWMLEVNVQ